MTKFPSGIRRFGAGVLATLGVLLICAGTLQLAFKSKGSAVLLGRFLRETGIPISILSAQSDLNLNDLRNGRLRNLDVTFRIDPANLRARLETNVQFERVPGKHWTLHLDPTLSIDGLPKLRGNIDIDLDLKIAQQEKSTRASAALVRYDLGTTAPLVFPGVLDAGKLEIPALRARGDLSWDPRAEDPTQRWVGTMEVELPKLVWHAAGASAEANDLKLVGAIHWPDAPPLPLSFAGTSTLKSLIYQNGAIVAEEQNLLFHLSATARPSGIEPFSISATRPFRATLNGAWGHQPKSLAATLTAEASLDELFTNRLRPWLEVQFPALRRSRASGSLRLNTDVRFSNDKLELRGGRARLSAKAIDLPSRDLSLQDLSIDLPFSYPDPRGWGSLRVREVQAHSVTLRDLLFFLRASAHEVELTTEDEHEQDHPIRQSVWGGSIEVKNLYARRAHGRPAEISAEVHGGPFAIAAIQKDLCLSPEHPLKGSLEFHYPKLIQSEDAFHLLGSTSLTLLGGTATLGDIHLLTSQRAPRLRFSLEWKDFDLFAIGEWSGFGDMRGSLDGSFENVVLALTPRGPRALSYDLTVRGRPRSEKKISFYGRAVHNILETLGTHEEDLSGPGKFFLSLATLWRNWAPVKADLLGFHAKSDSEWTELRTFDPPPDADSTWCNPKNHYLLCGDGFTIPLNTHGVYPLLMKTSAFQEWLGGFLKRRSANAKTSKSECVPPW